jgi:hypothetical protein
MEATEVAKIGWWSQRSKTTKGLIIGGAILTLGVILYFTLKKGDETPEKKGAADKKGKGAADKKSGESTTSTDTTADTSSSSNDTSADTSTDNTSTGSGSSGGSGGGSTSGGGSGTTSTPARTIAAKDLPNSGKSCSMPRLQYDGNYDYVKCGGIWYTKSKPNPKTKTAKIAAWKSLGANKIATQKLNSRYPND